MAEVWRAQIEGPSGFSRAVAVKRILPHLLEHEGVIELFEREAAASALLHHVNIVQVFELVAIDGEYLLAMELVSGRDLAAILKQGPVPLAFVLSIALSIARALAHAHSLTGSDGPLVLLHRDVSPSNVLVGRDGAIKLSDFGVAKIQQHLSAVTQSKVRGKAAYMSPEQAAGEKIDARSDLFSLGVVLYEMVTGRRPFDSLLGAVSLRAGGKLEPPGGVLSDVIMKLLAADPADRFSDAESLVTVLAPLAHEHPWGERDTAKLLGEISSPATSDPTPATATASRSRRWWLLLFLLPLPLAAFLFRPTKVVVEPAVIAPSPSPSAIAVAPSPAPRVIVVEPIVEPVKKHPQKTKRKRQNLRDVEVRDPFER
jgi:serine/threonine protein kinase